MADKKISALPAATTPLGGTEVLPIVQGGTTDKVSVEDLTKGRAVEVERLLANGDFDNAAPSTSSVPIVRVNEGGAVSLWISGRGYTNMWVQAIQDDGSNNLKELLLQPLGGPVTIGDGNLIVGTAGKGIDFSANGGDVLSQYDEGTWTPTDASGAGLSLTVTNATFTRVGKMVFANFNITYPATANASTARLGGLPYASSSAGFSHPMAVSTCQTGICKSGLVDSGAPTFLLIDTTGNVLTVAQMSGLNLRGTVIYEAA